MGINQTGAPTQTSTARDVVRRFEPAIWVLAGIVLLGAVTAANRARALESEVSAIIVAALETAPLHAAYALRHEAQAPGAYNTAYLAENTRMITDLIKLAVGPELSPAAARGLARYGSWLADERVSVQSRLEVSSYLATTLREARWYVPRLRLRAAVRRRLTLMLENYMPSEEPGET